MLEVADGHEVVVPILPTVETEAWPERRSRARRRAAIGAIAVAGAVAAVFAFAVVLPDLTQQSGILGETGRPQVSPAGGVALDTPKPTEPAITAQPTASQPPPTTPSPEPSTTPSPSAASSGSVKTASVTPQPPAVTPRPPAVTPRPTPTPPPTPTPKPTPTPTVRPPTPTPVPPPVAFFTCTVTLVTTLNCDGSASDNAVSYVWDFSEGDIETGPQASHTYLLPGLYDVTLTVTNASGSNSDTQQYTIP